MTCKLRKRVDDIPKRRGEHTWACDQCGALMVSKAKPVCRLEMLARMNALRAAAEVEAAELHLDEKIKP